MKLFLFLLLTATSGLAGEWTIPLAGNTYRTAPAPGSGINRAGKLVWSNPEEVHSIYVHLDQAATFDVALRGASPTPVRWKLASANQSFEIETEGADLKDYPVGKIKVAKAGYLKFDLSGLKKTGANFGEISDLILQSGNDDLKLHFVKSNKGNMFYWGRRGPSVHLGYQVPKGKNIEWAYSEITVPKGEDPIGSYFMANGFGQGYFGFQVKSPTERWVLFSVWSPFKTNNPNAIPEKDRVTTLAKGRDVRAQKFGGEGSGGQSFLKYPWQSGKTYRFLTRVQPNDDDTTVYTSWFGDKEANEWQLIASFRRPRTKVHLTGFHSFLENFSVNFGAEKRLGLYGNQWVCDTSGNWHEITRARFTADATARGGHRLDYAGGTKDGVFFMKNGGFFDDRVEFDQWFEKPSNPETKPTIDFKNLPKGEPVSK
ncbi:DUF3472 domain-containing protein [Akkermansiaceae bacterium]|nr:DUF3472 domain-containing protein [Akkermansiaceae bacterium]MDA7891919.1 DUF3472 domain-containing protein [Akkermansiaceae bacterium]MDA7896079.1 DUF3472 domain-containing protein [bacterium]